MIYTGNKSWTGSIDTITQKSGQQTVSFVLEEVNRLRGKVIEAMLLDLGEEIGNNRGFGRVKSVMISADNYSLIVGTFRFLTMPINIRGRYFAIGDHLLPLEGIKVTFGYSTPVVEIEEVE